MGTPPTHLSGSWTRAACTHDHKNIYTSYMLSLYLLCTLLFCFVREGGGWGEWHLSSLPSLNDVYIHVHCTHQHKNIHQSLFLFIPLRTHAHSDPSLQVRACNLLGGYLTHKETNMRYLALESLSHLATSDLSREAVKKHQDTVLEQLKVSSVTVYM